MSSLVSLRSALAAADSGDPSSTSPLALESALRSVAPAILANLLPKPKNPTERQQLQDPQFAHRGHRLEPLGRQVVLLLSDELNASELACWDLLQRTAEAAPSASVLDLRSLAASAYRSERLSMLLLLLDALKLASAAANPSSPARPAALALIDGLNAAAASSSSSAAAAPGATAGGAADASLMGKLAALFSQLQQAEESKGSLGTTAPTITTTPAATTTAMTAMGGGGGGGFGGLGGGFGLGTAAPAAATPSFALTTTTPGAAAAAPAPATDNSSAVMSASDLAAAATARKEEQQLTCLCLFYSCLYEGGGPSTTTTVPPPAAAASLLIDTLRATATTHGPSEPTDLLLVSLLTLLAPPPPPTSADARYTSTALVALRPPLPQPYLETILQKLSTWASQPRAAERSHSAGGGANLLSPSGAVAGGGAGGGAPTSPRTPGGTSWGAAMTGASATHSSTLRLPSSASAYSDGCVAALTLAAQLCATSTTAPPTLDSTTVQSALGLLLQLASRLEVGGAAGASGWAVEPHSLALEGVTALFEALLRHGACVPASNTAATHTATRTRSGRR